MIHRRRLIQWGIGAGAAVAVPGAALASGHTPHGRRHLHPKAPPRVVNFKNLHTDEALEAVYWEKGAYVPDALVAVNKVLRDFRTGEVHVIEPRLLDILSDLHHVSGSRAPFQVLSGYRSPATNAALREQSAEVAKRSLHMDGKAIDLYLEDVELARLREAALDLSRGGVGFYPTTGFVHMDVGPVRHWTGA